MPLHPQAAAFLKSWNALGIPPMESQPVAETRRLLSMSGCGPLAGCPALAHVAEHHVPGPGGPIRVRRYVPFGAEPYGVGLYFHGGGWVLNSIDTHDDVGRRIAAASGCQIVNVDYRLAPEHPYPAAVEDAYAVLEWVATEGPKLGIDPTAIAVAGDSAGGNLAAALCQMTRDRGGPPIAHQALLYPITDCDLTRPSYVRNAEGYFLTTSQMRWFWEHYCPDIDRRREPYASPLRGDLTGLPPALIYTAEYDPLCDEGEAYAAALTTAGVPVTLRRMEGLIHAFIRRVESFDAAKTAIADLGAAMREHLGVNG